MKVIFHAAAYKHVPLIELSPWEAVFNNVKGSKCLIEAARFWLVKFPRGRTEADRTVLRNEAPYYEVARWFGIRTDRSRRFPA